MRLDPLGPSGAIKSVIRAVPVAFLSPAVGVARGLSELLLGARNAADLVRIVLSREGPAGG